MTVSASKEPTDWRRSVGVRLALLFAVLGALTVLVWAKTDRNGVMGDEPHYLVMASGFADYGHFEQTRPYEDEVANKAIYPPGIGGATHAHQGPNGLFNIHNIGLPAVLALPFLIGGVIGAKIAMVALGACAAFLAWKASGQFTADAGIRGFATAAVSLSAMQIGASTQVYPDLPAGVISLAGLYLLLSFDEPRSRRTMIGGMALITFLPWLQIKFALSCVILTLAVLAFAYGRRRDLREVLQLAIAPAISASALAAYNLYAFGSIAGPYESDALELSRTALMTFVGLHIDQDQGYLFQNPVLFAALPAMAGFLMRNVKFGIVWALVYLSLIVPNSLHPNWYGGYSLAGRFASSAATVMVLPAVFALVKLGAWNRRVLMVVCALALLLQGWLYYHLTWVWADEYAFNRSTGPVPADMYAILFPDQANWLPMLYDVTRAPLWPPNFAWALLVLVLLLAGLAAVRAPSRRTVAVVGGALTAGCALVIAAGAFSRSDWKHVDFGVSGLPSLTGRFVDGAIVAEPGVDRADFVNFGPYANITKGRYRVTLQYASAAPESADVARFDISDADAGARNQVNITTLRGTNGASKTVSMVFEFKAFDRHRFQFRTNWMGTHPIRVEKLTMDIL